MTHYLFIKQNDMYQATPLPPDEGNGRSMRIPCKALDQMLGIYATADGPQTSAAPRRNALFIPKSHAFVRIDTACIQWLEASRSYCILHMEDGTSQTESLPLAEVERYLPSDRFIRIHRSYTVNLDYVEAFAGNEVIIGQQHIPIGKQYRNLIDRHFTVMRSRKGR